MSITSEMDRLFKDTYRSSSDAEPVVFSVLPPIKKCAPYAIQRISDGWYYQTVRGPTDHPIDIWTPHLSLAFVCEYPQEPGPGRRHVPVRKKPKSLPRGV